MFSFTAFESAQRRISLCSSAYVFKKTCIKSQLKYIPPASVISTSAYYCSCAPSLPKKHVVQAPRINGALLQKRTKCVPSTSINPTSSSYCSCTPSLLKYGVQAPSSPFTCPTNSKPCSRLLAVFSPCLEAKRSLQHSLMSCTRTSSPLMKASKPLFDRSLVPELLEKDLIETAIKGWGPGGQAVNKTNNAVYLKHVPTGLFVKVHQHRMRHLNSLEARERLLGMLDDLVNGPRSVSAQKARLLEKRSAKSQSKAKKMRDLKAQWKQSLVGADTGAGEGCQRDEGDGLRDESAGCDGLRDESAGCDGLRDESAGCDGLRDESAGCDGLRDESDGLRDRKAGSSGVDSLGDKRADNLVVDSKVGNWEQGNDPNKRV